ncbi:MAG: PIN domain-containing protein [Spirochaetaceae bacterium]|nr:PIN domain-containing protein [Spirochaetaceae bacterium]
MKILVDTCVIIDALQNRQPFASDAQKLFLAVANRNCTACISAKAVTDIYYITHRQTHSDEQTRIILKKLFSLFDVVDTFGIDCINAVTSQMGDYEDAVMSETAERNSIDYIVTRNIKDYSKSKVQVITPTVLLGLL